MKPHRRAMMATAIVAVCGLIAGTALTATPAHAAVPTAGPPAEPCPIRVDIRAGVNVGTGTLATFTLTNVSTATIAPPWTMTWRFPNGQRIWNVFNTRFEQVGTLIILTSPPWYQVLAAGTTSTIPNGFTITNPIEAPTEVTFNGHTNCTVTLS